MSDVLNQKGAPGNAIQSIDKESISRICSGQVVVDLSNAVKELVENSLDAGATSVDIVLKDCGIDSIVVSDNGDGIAKSDYDCVALKHYTSKLSNFADLSSVLSYGFRGEALNALCELSGNLTVSTKTIADTIGTLLRFDKQGRVTDRSPVARSVGTTITVENIFKTLPVRHNVFKSSIKKQYRKMLQVMQGYAIIATKVKLNLSNITSKGVRQNVLGTQCFDQIKENICSVFGSKFAASLMPVEIALESDMFITDANKTEHVDHTPNSPIAAAGSPSVDPTSVSSSPVIHAAANSAREPTRPSDPSIRIQGFISRAGLGVGRSDQDRQYIYCNGRPVDLPKYHKALNEVWRQYEMKHKPAFILEIRIPSKFLDVNLSPDKRNILFTSACNNLILDTLVAKINALYLPSRNTFPVSQTFPVSSQVLPPSVMSSASTVTTIYAEDVDDNDMEEAYEVGGVAEIPAPNVDCATDGDGNGQIYPPIVGIDPSFDIVSVVDSEDSYNVLFETNKRKSKGIHSITGIKGITGASNGQSDDGEFNDLVSGDFERQVISKKLRLEEPMATSAQEHTRVIHSLSDELIHDEASVLSLPAVTSVVQEARVDEKVVENEIDWEVSSTVSSSGEDGNVLLESDAFPHTLSSFLPSPSPAVKAPAVKWNMTNQMMRNLCTKRLASVADSPSEANKVLWANTDSPGFISNDNSINVANPDAIPQNLRVLSKEEFPKMRIIGQFNLGFIIVWLRGDLYILDQHACDEKYRYEMLQRTTVIHQQPLIAPIKLQLSSLEQAILREHLPLFEANGFRIRITQVSGEAVDVGVNANAAPELNNSECLEQEQDIFELLAVPFSKHIMFGESDIIELASIISSMEDSGLGSSYDFQHDAQQPVNKKRMLDKSHVRLRKISDMFASRACRSAIMIGMPLQHHDMQSIVQHMGVMDQPWNCPHGRPTMRHLVHLQPLLANCTALYK